MLRGNVEACQPVTAYLRLSCEVCLLFLLFSFPLSLSPDSVLWVRVHSVPRLVIPLIRKPCSQLDYLLFCASLGTLCG